MSLLEKAKKLDSDEIFGGDKTIWMVLFLLSVISVVEVYSASSNMSYKTGAFWEPAVGHLRNVLLGWALAIFFCRRQCTHFKLIPLFFGPFAIAMLVYAMFFGESVNGAARWVLGFQPSEMAKGVLVATIALILSLCYDQEKDAVTQRGFNICAIVTGVTCLLILPENLSTALLTGAVVFLLMLVGRANWKYLSGIFLAFALTGTLALVFMRTAPMSTIKTVSEVTALHRLPTWANRIRSASNDDVSPDKLDMNKDQHVIHAKIAVATSGLVGKGPGNSVERDYLPQAYADFIFAIIIEEFGLLGGLCVVSLYIILLFRAGIIAARCERRFPALLCMGMAMLIVLQAMINVCVCVGLLPVTGQQLPLVSRGGTGFILNCAYVGIILSISRTARKTPDADDVEPILIDNN